MAAFLYIYGGVLCLFLVLLISPMTLWLHLLLFSMSLSFLITPLIRYGALTIGVMDYPDERKIHTHPTPLLGGMAICIAFFSATLWHPLLREEVTPILLGSSLVIVGGIYDDWRGIPPPVKLCIQAAAAVIVLFSGTTVTLFGRGIVGMILNGVLTLLWIVGITNALNFFDGMDGLAGGLSIIIAFFLSIIALQSGQLALGFLSIALIGSCAGFLPYNFRVGRPATIFLGDAGSSFLGFTLACFAVKGDWADNNPIVSLSAPILIFGVLIYDTIHITVDRLVTGRVTTFSEWIRYVGRDHLHHRLSVVLKGQQASLFFIYALNVTLGIAALVVRKAHTWEAILLVLQACIIVSLVTVLEKTTGSRKRMTRGERAAPQGRAQTRVRLDRTWRDIKTS